MKKNIYITPTTEYIKTAPMQFFAASRLDNTTDDQSVSVTDEEYNGEFSTRQFKWYSESDEN